MRFPYRERIEGLNDLVGIYKDKHGAINSGGNNTPFGKLRNPQPPNKAETIVFGIDNIVEAVEAHNQIGMERNPSAIIGALRHAVARYEKEFKPDAILIRAEMQSRLASNGLTEPGPAAMGMGASAYEHPTNPLG